MTVRRWIAPALLVVLGALLVGQLQDHAPAHDEPIHMVTGLRWLRTHELIDPTHPPLVFVLQALPLLGMDIDLHLADDSWARELSGHYYADVLLRSGTSMEAMLLAARLMAIPFALALAYLVWRWARRLWGDGGGALALALAVFSPAVLADGALVGNDIAVALAMVLALAAFRSYLLSPTPRTRLLFALAFALAQLVKFSSVLLAPILAAIWIAKLLLERRGLSPATAPPPKQALKDALVVAGVTALVIWAGYGFEVATLADDPMLRLSRNAATAQKALAGIPSWLPHLPLPAYSYIKGNALQAFHSANHAAWDPTGDLFLLGDHRANGWWYYFPIAFAVKTPLALFALLGLLMMWRRRAPRTDPFELVLLVVPAVLWMLACMTISINIGVRYLLPIYPLLFILLGGLAPVIADRVGRIVAVVTLCLWGAVATLAVYPHPHAYFNELAGGPDGGWRVLNNSSLDWGQDVPLARDYLIQHDIWDAYVDLFGSIPASEQAVPGRPLPKDPAALARLKGVVVVSTTRLTTHNRFEPLYTRLRQLTPKARLGHTIFVYEL